MSVVKSVDVVNPDHHILEFRRINYTENACNSGVCKQTVVSVSNSGRITLMPGEATWTTFSGGTVRGVVLSNSPDMQVNVMIINSTTGEVLSIDKSTPLLMKD